MNWRVYVRRWLIIIAATLVVLVVTSYFAFRTSSVRVENHSSGLISNIRVALGGKVFWKGRLSSGESHRAYGFVPEDGDIVILFMKDAMEHRSVFSPVTTLWPDHHVLTITPAMKVECSSTFAECKELTEQWRQDAIDKFLSAQKE